jgi:hypothetical protein
METIIETEFYEDGIKKIAKNVSLLLKGFNQVIRKNYKVTEEYLDYTDFPRNYCEFLNFAENMKFTLFIQDVAVYKSSDLISFCIDWLQIEKIVKEENLEGCVFLENQEIYRMIQDEKQLSF